MWWQRTKLLTIIPPRRENTLAERSRQKKRPPLNRQVDGWPTDKKRIRASSLTRITLNVWGSVVPRKPHLGFPVSTSVLLEREDLRVLRVIAAERGTSVSELLRFSLRKTFAAEFTRFAEAELVQEASR